MVWIQKVSHSKKGDDKKVADLIKDMNSGKVDALLIYGVDPVFTLGDKFKKALGKERELIITNRTDIPQHDQQDIVTTEVKGNEYSNNNPINKLESINKDNNQESDQIKIEDNNFNAQNLADFFNGEIIDTNANP